MNQLLAMNKIHQLPDHIIAKIAAGEVIERPAYAVKELIENAIDAKADEITISIEEAGLKKITIADNGEGMNKDDVAESVKLHTTSKLIDETFTHIHSLGFRGEALASIAAMSHLTIKSRTADEPGGTMIDVKNGVVGNVKPLGMPVGTTVIVQNLFGSVPARKKFLKSDRTEFRQILDIITTYAVSFPEIHFSVSHNNRRILYLPKQSLSERIYQLLGHDITEHLFPLTSDEGYVTISGFLAHPQITSQSASKQFIFVNNRAVTDRMISLAVKEAYGTLLEPASHPLFVLFISLPYETVDVNVHPRKEQVHFINGQLLFEELTKAVHETLTKNNLTFQNIGWKQSHFSARRGNMKSFTGAILRDEVIPWNVQRETKSEHLNDITQIHNLYLLTQSAQGFLLIDQHAAHERILFEQYLTMFKEKQRERQMITLPEPIRFSIPVPDKELLEEYNELLENFGFVFTIDNQSLLTITQIPLLLKDYAIKQFFYELLDDLRNEKQVKILDNQTRKIITYLACRTAIKAGERLTKEQIKELINKLEQTPNNATCPHGRPTKIEVSLNELHKMFKRR